MDHPKPQKLIIVKATWEIPTQFSEEDLERYRRRVYYNPPQPLPVPPTAPPTN